MKAPIQRRMKTRVKTPNHADGRYLAQPQDQGSLDLQTRLTRTEALLREERIRAERAATEAAAGFYKLRAELETQMERASRAIQSARDHEVARAEEVAAWQQRVASMENSTSWRITAPLRALGRLRGKP